MADTFVSVCSGAWRPKNTLVNWLALQSMLELECRAGTTEYFWLRHPTSWVRRRIRRVLDEAAIEEERGANIVVLDPSLRRRQIWVGHERDERMKGSPYAATVPQADMTSG